MEAHTLPCCDIDSYDVATLSPLKMEAHTLSCCDIDSYDVVTSSHLKTKIEEQPLLCCDIKSFDFQDLKCIHCHVMTLAHM